MIERDGTGQQLVCDTCPETSDVYDRDEFQRMIDTAKAEGWVIRPGKDGWTHTCPSCATSSNFERQKALLG